MEEDNSINPGYMSPFSPTRYIPLYMPPYTPLCRYPAYPPSILLGTPSSSLLGVYASLFPLDLSRLLKEAERPLRGPPELMTRGRKTSPRTSRTAERGRKASPRTSRTVKKTGRKVSPRTSRTVQNRQKGLPRTSRTVRNRQKGLPGTSSTVHNRQKGPTRTSIKRQKEPLRLQEEEGGGGLYTHQGGRRRVYIPPWYPLRLVSRETSLAPLLTCTSR